MADGFFLQSALMYQEQPQKTYQSALGNFEELYG
jgi:hypothetical protein